MGKIYSFLLGVVVGFGLYHLAGLYHVVRSDSGLHLVQKVSPTLDETYVDVRGYGPRDWAEHPALTAAVAKSDNEELKSDAVNTTIDQLLPGAQE